MENIYKKVVARNSGNEQIAEEFIKEFNELLEAGKHEEAYTIAKERHDNGMQDGTYALSKVYGKGYFVEANIEMEFKLLQEAAKKFYHPAIFDLIGHSKGSHSYGYGEFDMKSAYSDIWDLAIVGYDKAVEIVNNREKSILEHNLTVATASGRVVHTSSDKCTEFKHICKNIALCKHTEVFTDLCGKSTC